MRLMIFKVNQLGDNVVFLPVVQQLARQHPDWEITICTSPTAAPLYHTACPNVVVKEFITRSFNNAWRRPVELMSLIRQFRALPQDYCLLGNDQSNVAHLLARVSGACRITGPLIAERYLGCLLHRRVAIDFSQPDPVQNWRIAQGLLEDLKQTPMPEQIPPPDLSAFGSTRHGGVFVHAGASRDYKRWPLENFIGLANSLSTTSPVMWMNMGEAVESRLLASVQRVQPGTLTDLIRHIAGARLFIGNNSGPMNIASALGIPGVIFNGPSLPVWDPFWHRENFEILRDNTLACQPCDLPLRPRNVCINADEPMACMKRWSVDRVHEIALEKLRCSSIDAPPPERA